jgi:putative toxin-antitoxin system antitoxin component (TIGR02293 family)
METLEELATIESTDDSRMLDLIKLTREGIKFNTFYRIAMKGPFDMHDWSDFLHLSERTFQRYKKEKKKFSSLHSEKILEITILYVKGIDIFGDKNNFNSWLDSENVALGGIKPRELMDSSFGIELIKDELTRIEHGVLA